MVRHDGPHAGEPRGRRLDRRGVAGRVSDSGVLLRWAFHGSTSGTFAFTFTAVVRGLLVNATQRASLASGVTDDPAGGYPDRAGSEALTSGNLFLEVQRDTDPTGLAASRAEMWAQQLGRVALVMRTDALKALVADRDAHLRSNDFFDAENHPHMTFRSTRITRAGEDRYKVAGDMSIRGVTREIVFDVTFEGENRDPWGNRRRGFTADDDAVVVLSDRYWRSRFSADRSVVGRPMTLNGVPFTIVGVTPPEFRGLSPGREIELTLPITQARDMLANVHTWSWYTALARLKPGTTVEQATAQADTIFQSFMSAGIQSDEMRAKHFARIELASAARGPNGLRARFATPLLALWLVAAVVLLIACVNLGNLLLVRGDGRVREMAVRTALGASPKRLARQLFTESLVLAVAGAVLGIALVFLALQVLTSVDPASLPPIAAVRLDRTVMAFTLLLAIAATILFGLVPAVVSAGAPAAESLKDGTRSSTGARGRRISRALVVAEVALACAVLVASALLVRSVARMMRAPSGIISDNVVTTTIQMSGAAYQDWRKVEQFYTALLESARRQPGIDSVGASTMLALEAGELSAAVDVRLSPTIFARSTLPSPGRTPHFAALRA